MGKASIPASKGYLLVDTKRCSGCESCMLGCSLAHEGKASLTFSRIQILQNSLMPFPHDLTIAQCRQCVSPACVAACPNEALTVNQKHGNVRMIDKEKCIGCQTCIKACPYTPARIAWNRDEKKAIKCDLCADTPFWGKDGGIDGKQICVAVCPHGAIEFTGTVPMQEGNLGYNVEIELD